MNNKYVILSSLFLFFLTIPAAYAQQSSKSKSKDRFREKSAPGRVQIRNAAIINGPGNESSPAYYDDGIVFASNSGKTGPSDKRYLDRPSSDLFFALLDGNEEPMVRSEFSKDINSSLNEGQATFSRDKKTMYFTRNNNKNGVQKADANGKVRMKIYEARLNKYYWEDNVGELPFNDDNYACMHPCLSTDGTKLYFSSDMPGGYGGYDLYVSEKTGRTWGPPVNLGPEINTDKNDVYPFISFSGKTLFFTSGGHNTLGGLDLFYINLDKKEDGAVNLDAPFNTPNDDLAIIMNEDGTKGFFVSDRPGGHGNNDLYTFSIESGIEGVEKPVTNRVQIMVTDARTGQPIPKAAIRILKPSDDGFISAQNDFYDVDLTPTPESPNSLSLRLIRKNADALGNPDNYTNGSGVAYADFMMYRSYLILASYDGYQTSERLYSVEPDKGGIVSLALFEEAVCHRTAGIVSTDKFGTRIAGATLVFIHKESNQQVTAHSDENGEYDICLPLEGEYLMQVKREGFRTQNLNLTAVRSKSVNTTVRMSPVDINAADAEKAEALLARPLQDGYLITMDKIRFEPGKSTLNQSAVRHLDALIELMQRYPEMEIDLTVHTDSRGDAKANLALSNERAQNAKTYLLYKGIEENRVFAIGKGEMQVRNRCVDGVQCSDLEHEANNRIEVRVRKVGNTIKTP